MVINPTTAAETPIVYVNAGTTFKVVGTIGSYIITIQQSNGAGGWINIVEDGTTKQLDADNTVVSFYSSGTIRVNKPSTTNAIGISCE